MGKIIFICYQIIDNIIYFQKLSKFINFSIFLNIYEGHSNLFILAPHNSFLSSSIKCSQFITKTMYKISRLNNVRNTNTYIL